MGRRIGLIFLLAGLLGGCANLRVGDTADARAEQAAAAAAYATGDYTAAARAYEALSGSPASTAQEWFRLGNAYVELDRPVDAAAAFRQALDKDPDYQRARHNLGVVYLQLGVTSVLEARRSLPPVDAAAAATMRYLACIMETFMGMPDPVTCRDLPPTPAPGLAR